MKPTYYDIKTAATKCRCSSRELLLFAHEERLSLGIYVHNREALLLRDGKNIHIQPGDKSLHRAYDGTKRISGILYLDRHYISGLLKRDFISTSIFSYRKDGYDEALLMINTRPDVMTIKLEDLFIDAHDLNSFLAQSEVIHLSKRRRASNDMNEVVIDLVKELMAEHKRKPTAKEVWSKLTEKPNGHYRFPINAVEEMKLHWENGFQVKKTMSFRRVENIVSETTKRQ